MIHDGWSRWWRRPLPGAWGPLTGACLVGILGVLPPAWVAVGPTGLEATRRVLYGIGALTALVQAFPARVRDAAHVALGVAALIVALDLGHVVPFLAFAAATLWLSRPHPGRWQPWVLLALWAIPVGVRWSRPAPLGDPTDFVFAALWAGQLYAGLLTVLERRKGLRVGEPAQLVHLLLHPVRVIHPFFQPLSPADVRARQAPPWTPLLLVRGLGLFALGQALLRLGGSPVPWAELPRLLHPVATLLHTYVRFAAGIFVAVGLLRLMGWHLRSGFDAPFLARTFSEFFQRWNHYVRDAVVAIFYLPLAQRLAARGWTPRAVHGAAAFVAILLGSLTLNELLVPVVVARAPLEAAVGHASSRAFVGAVVLWLGVALRGPGALPKPSVGRRALETLRFWGLLYALHAALLWLWPAASR